MQADLACKIKSVDLQTNYFYIKLTADIQLAPTLNPNMDRVQFVIDSAAIS